MYSNKFQDAQNKLVIQATRVAGNYLLSKYGSAHISGEPVVELTHTQDDVTAAFKFSGKITCYANDGLLKNIGVNMTVNSNDIEIASEDIQSNVTNALNSAEQNKDIFVASLDGFHLTDDGSKYLKVSHTAAHDSVLGIVGKNEYSASKDKAALLQGILKDAAIAPKVEFTGEFKEPTIEKYASGCDQCSASMINGVFCHETGCPNKKKKERDEDVESSLKTASLSAKATWLTAELFKDAEEDIEAAHKHNDDLGEIDCDRCNKQMCTDCGTTDDDGTIHHNKCKKGSLVAIQENMLRGKSADHLAQTAQLEDQSALEAQIKVEHEAANELMSTLQGMGYGSAKAVEITSSKEGFDIMTAVDHAGAVKAVSIPVSVKEGKYTLPKKSIIATLIEKGLNVQAKLAEQFDLEALEKLAAIDEKLAYENQEVVDILNEKVASVEKVAVGEKQTFFDSDSSTMTLNKHLLPNSEDYKDGDELSDGVDKWRIVNQHGLQNDKNEGSSSQWTLKKVQAPEDDGKPAENQIPS